jgi:hypothetical protein
MYHGKDATLTPCRWAEDQGQRKTVKEVTRKPTKINCPYCGYKGLSKILIERDWCPECGIAQRADDSMLIRRLSQGVIFTGVVFGVWLSQDILLGVVVIILLAALWIDLAKNR